MYIRNILHPCEDIVLVEEKLCKTFYFHISQSLIRPHASIVEGIKLNSNAPCNAQIDVFKADKRHSNVSRHVVTINQLTPEMSRHFSLQDVTLLALMRQCRMQLSIVLSSD